MSEIKAIQASNAQEEVKVIGSNIKISEKLSKSIMVVPFKK